MTTATTGLRALLDAVADRNGGILTPEMVVEEARPAASPLHSQLEWDDSVAGEEYRLVQAGRLIRVVRCEVTTTEGDEVTVRRFVSTAGTEHDPKATVYRRFEDVQADPKRAAELRSQIEADWRTLQRKWSLYEELLREVVNG